MRVPQGYRGGLVNLMTDIEQLEVKPDQIARVVIDERSGVIVMGSDVRISTVALAIENPSALDIEWMAPISQYSMIVSGVSQFLDDTTTVMKVQLKIDPDTMARHDEWQLP